MLDLTPLGSVTRVRGIGRYLTALALGIERFDTQRWGIEWLALQELSWLGKVRVVSSPGVAVRELLARPHPSLRSHASWAYQKRLWTWKALLSQRRVDLLHSGHPDATPLGAVRARRVVTCHDLIPLAFPGQYAKLRDGFGPGRKALDWRRYHRADHIIAISHATARELVSRLQIEPKRISVVYNGVDLERWSPRVQPSDEPALTRYGLENRSYLLFVGDGDWRKNAEGMLSTLARLLRKPETSGLVLAWVGKLSTDKKQRIERLARAMDVWHSVRLLGFVPDEQLAALYRHAAALLFVSRAEGFGYPVVEAMACGCPVVASRESSVGEIAGDAAVLVDPERHAEIAGATAEVVLATGENREALVRAGLKRAKRFGLKQMVEGTVEVYRAVARAGHDWS